MIAPFANADNTPPISRFLPTPKELIFRSLRFVNYKINSCRPPISKDLENRDLGWLTTSYPHS
jgi:hypothetical protein